MDIARSLLREGSNAMSVIDESERIIRSYFKGQRAAIEQYSWWKDMETYIGIYGTTKRSALNRLMQEEDAALNRNKLGTFNVEDLWL
jgi:hypothetical protein